MVKISKDQINKNFKWLLIISVILLSFYNTQIFTLINTPIFNEIISYLCSPLPFVVAICLGYLAISEQYNWKFLGKFILYLIPLFFLSGLFAVDFFNVKEYGFDIKLLITDFIKSFFWYEGRWIITTTIVLIVLYKCLLYWPWFQQEKNQLIIWIVLTALFFSFVFAVTIAFNVLLNKQDYVNFNYALISVTFRVPNFSKAILAILAFLLGVSFNYDWLVSKINNLLVWLAMAVIGYFSLTILRLFTHLSMFHWDILVIISAFLFCVPFVTMHIKFNDKWLKWYYASLVLLIFHNSFNKLYGVEFILGMFLRLIFGWWTNGVTTYWNILNFVTANIWVALVYSLLKYLAIYFTCFGIAVGYNKLWKKQFKLMLNLPTVDPQVLTEPVVKPVNN
ncbi:hypothetical protein [Spiroplasma eriocheiris]|uniref:Transmembrane protein n=1 Tax=Spiroplasma eriocheiris TaxID=315358 RepID=A0A0H3XID1_9MOLU|nr:hypothetical protein [Spiroplasma eriocheiris]AKM54638.1 hypothetical protein SERIO_v1c10850 [Spiroplasma eriocheiris]